MSNKNAATYDEISKFLTNKSKQYTEDIPIPERDQFVDLQRTKKKRCHESTLPLQDARDQGHAHDRVH